MKTVLIVDDSRTFQNLLSHVISPHFQVVGKGSSGLEGIDLYQKLKPDLVLMDITMPNCSGKECLQKIREYDTSAQVVMVSSLGDDQTISECLALGAKAFVKKHDVSRLDQSDSILISTLQRVVSESSTSEKK